MNAENEKAEARHTWASICSDHEKIALFNLQHIQSYSDFLYRLRASVGLSSGIIFSGLYGGIERIDMPEQANVPKQIREKIWLSSHEDFNILKRLLAYVRGFVPGDINLTFVILSLTSDKRRSQSIAGGNRDLYQWLEGLDAISVGRYPSTYLRKCLIDEKAQGRSKFLLIGDSIIAYSSQSSDGLQATMSQYYGGDVRIIDYAKAGDNSRATLKSFRMIWAEHCRSTIAVIYHGGTNDACISNRHENERHVPVDEFKSHLEMLIDCAAAYGVPVILSTTLPARGPQETKVYPRDDARYVLRDCNTMAARAQAIREVCHDHRGKAFLVDTHTRMRAFSDLREDGMAALLMDYVHPNEDGHRLLAQLIIRKVNWVVGSPRT